MVYLSSPPVGLPLAWYPPMDAEVSIYPLAWHAPVFHMF